MKRKENGRGFTNGRSLDAVDVRTIRAYYQDTSELEKHSTRVGQVASRFGCHRKTVTIVGLQCLLEWWFRVEWLFVEYRFDLSNPYIIQFTFS